MQTRVYAGPFQDHNPDYTGVPWVIYGTSESHIDGSDLTGYLSHDLTGKASLAHTMLYDDEGIPDGVSIDSVTIRCRLGLGTLTYNGALAVVPYIRYDGGPPVFQQQFQPPHAADFAEYEAEFPRDPSGLPWSRASIYAKLGKLLRFGLLTSITPLYSAELDWSECRFVVNFTLAEPIVVTDPASMIAATAAQLNGRVNPRGANGNYPVKYWFEYGETTDYGMATVPVDGLTGSAEVVVSAPIDSLGVNVGYHFRLVASTADGTFYGADAFFTTDPARTGRFRLDEFKRVATGEWDAGDRTRMTAPGFDRPSTSSDEATCPFLRFP